MSILEALASVAESSRLLTCAWPAGHAESGRDSAEESMALARDTHVILARVEDERSRCGLSILSWRVANVWSKLARRAERPTLKAGRPAGRPARAGAGSAR